jgi:hypothetical protein
MKTNRIQLDDIKMWKLKVLASKNERSTLNQHIVDLAFEIAFKAMDNLDEESFENVTGMKL